MIEAAGGFGFAEEARSRLDQFGIAEFAGQRNGLDRDQPVDGGVAPQIDDAHGAAADLALQLIAAEPLGVGQRGHGRRCGVAAGGGRRGHSAAAETGAVMAADYRALAARRFCRSGPTGAGLPAAGVASPADDARRRGLCLGALGIHELSQAGRDIAIGVVDAGQVAVHGGGLRARPRCSSWLPRV